MEYSCVSASTSVVYLELMRICEAYMCSGHRSSFPYLLSLHGYSTPRVFSIPTGLVLYTPKTFTFPRQSHPHNSWAAWRGESVVTKFQITQEFSGQSIRSTKSVTIAGRLVLFAALGAWFRVGVGDQGSFWWFSFGQLVFGGEIGGLFVGLAPSYCVNWHWLFARGGHASSMVSKPGLDM